MRIDLTQQFYNHDCPIFEKFNDPFSYVFIFGDMLGESHGFVVMQVTSPNNFVSTIHVPIYPYTN